MKQLLPSPLALSPLLFGAFLGLAIMQTGFPQRSVTIPARSASTLDDTVVFAEAPDVVSQVVPLSSPFDGKSSVSRVAVPETRPGGGQVATQTTRVADPVMTGTATVLERSEPPAPLLDVMTIKRLSELRRELRISESAVRARINLPADELFVVKSDSSIDPLAVPALEKIVEFLERTLKKKVTVRALYVPGEAGAKEQAWARSLTLINWLTENSSLDPANLTAGSPGPLDREVQKANATSPGELEFISRIELNIE
jgi:hypothetical protein